LRTLQREWDATMLESFQLKQHLDQARQELAHSLYQYDAACRVIARLVQERDQARDSLKNAQAGRAAAAAGGDRRWPLMVLLLLLLLRPPVCPPICSPRCSSTPKVS
jgi:hypothetical protein